MGKIVTTDNNEFLEDGVTPNPDFGHVTSIDFADPPYVPAALSKTAFNKYAASKLGNGAAGLARFQDILDACAASSGAVKFCSTQYQSAMTFEKAEVESFTSIMVGAGIMAADERAAIVGADWPQG